MPKITVGITTSGKAISVNSHASEGTHLRTDFGTFSERDMFDALLGLDYLSLSERRKSPIDIDWIDAIDEVRDYLRHSLTQETVISWKAQLHIDSAFVARNYGKSIIQKHFRSL